MSQAAHYDEIVDDYERHYFDETAMAYRRRYIYLPLFQGLDLNGKRVAELACGSGHNTRELLRLFPDAEPFGIDISPRSCEAYRRNTGQASFVADLSDKNAELPPPVDVAFVIGGLHHCVNDLTAAILNLRRIVRPGGLLLMVEPNAGFALNGLRMAWYKKDKWFHEAEEAPLEHSELLTKAGPYFRPISVRYQGGPAYFLILNSLITRIPLGMKRTLAPLAFLIDDAYNLLPWQASFPMFIARWRRTEFANDQSIARVHKP